jgi:hypothetical protein
MGWRVTIRHGSRVTKEKVDALDQAVGRAREVVDRVRREGNLPPISALRDFTPEQRVHARVTISRGLLRGPEGGLDVMGDGSLIAYSGMINKQPLAADTVDEALERLREALS